MLCELTLADILGSGQKSGTQRKVDRWGVACPEPYVSASSGSLEHADRGSSAAVFFNGLNAGAEVAARGGPEDHVHHELDAKTSTSVHDAHQRHLRAEARELVSVQVHTHES